MTDSRILHAMRRFVLTAACGVLFCGCPRNPAGTDASDVRDAFDASEVSVDDAPDIPPMPMCDAGPPPDAGFGGVVYTDDRAPCVDRNAQRNLYWGDLHVHTSLSFDSYAVGNRATPADAYRFARGEAIQIYADGGSRTVQLARPLDFAAVTDHSEFLGEVSACLAPESPGFNSFTCQSFRAGGNNGYAIIGYQASFTTPHRDRTVCGASGADCIDRARTVWQGIQDAAEAAYDRSSACRFTSFVAYEYSPTPAGNNLHRNVVFRNTHVPPLPISYFEATSGEALWRGLRDACTRACNGCEVLAIPHNSNFAAGNMFPLAPAPGLDLAAQRELAQLRNDTERLVEVYQHKGSSECREDLAPFGAPDEACSFEIIRNTLAGNAGSMPNTIPPCPDGGAGTGCYSPQDYVRHVLTNGLGEANRLGVNPFQLGIIGSTDTHNGTPGNVDERSFRGHVASQDYALLSSRDNSPGGIAGVWAVENSRDAIFEALRRRETYSTSGPRITLRFFGGYGYPAGLCGDAMLVTHGYEGGVPMGGMLPARPAGVAAPSFIVQAARDETKLARAQIVKGWVDASGTPHERVYDVATTSGSPAVDVNTCTTNGQGEDTLCSVWTDPDFDPNVRAYWYVRVLEGPSCRWSTWQCLSIPAADRPATCSDPSVARTIEERAISSPIWYEPSP